MQGVTSALILRNESWVRKQASALARRLPSNVETDHHATAAELSTLCGLSAVEILEIESQAGAGQWVSLSTDPHGDDDRPPPEPATEHDEVEARVDTSLLLRRLESFFAALPERDRLVIDAYLGLGLSPVKLGQSMNLSPSRVSQLFNAICERIGLHLAPPGHRAIDLAGRALPTPYEQVLAEREAELARSEASGAWTERLAEVLLAPPSADGPQRPPDYIEVTRTTRWG